MPESNSVAEVSAAPLAPTAIVDSDHPAVRAFATARSAGADTPRARAIQLYYAVRDEIRYDPYGAAVSVEALARRQRGFGAAGETTHAPTVERGSPPVKANARESR